VSIMSSAPSRDQDKSSPLSVSRILECGQASRSLVLIWWKELGFQPLEWAEGGKLLSVSAKSSHNYKSGGRAATFGASTVLEIGRWKGFGVHRGEGEHHAHCGEQQY